ncbi:MAG: exodeoxyribonuclease VII large subunit [Syntrophomonadaceae bacterium]|nr:exodeoxyribonuclease VII large subunit [Syntrophomonadaceae bacterium]
MRDYFTVQGLNLYIEQLFSADEVLSSVRVKGEISGFKFYRQSGHMYFTLKDEDAALNCVMFKSRAARLKFMPEDGMEVLVSGYVSVYSKQGRYQLYAEDMQADGDGAWYRYLEKLKLELNAEGCFDPARKRPLPPMANRIGIVSSLEGAALRDILRILQERCPSLQAVIAHSAVQGPEAPAELAAAMERLNRYGALDVIIIGRGGGSMEDLMAFNSPEVVRAVAASRLPVISAVGHEVDVSLCDLAADVRAATPTQAAQLAVSDGRELKARCRQLENRLSLRMEWIMRERAQRFDQIMAYRVWSDAEAVLKPSRYRLEQLGGKIERVMERQHQQRQQRLSSSAEGLDRLSPLKVMARGYAIVLKDGAIVRSAQAVASGEEADVRLSDGTVKVRVLERSFLADGGTT